MDSSEALNAPHVPAGSSPATAVHHSLVAASGEQCPSCGNPVASDQRYCLNCGQRCGEPRLPFMNAVTFMEAMKRPAASSAAPPRKTKRRLSPNAALIAGVGTLLLAMGVGVLIGRSGHDSGATNAAATPQVIKVEGGGGTAETETAAVSGKGAGGTGKSKPSKKAAKQAQARADSGKGAEEVLKPSGDVKLPPATVQPGEKCESGAAGCKGGEFTGEFFGE
jgi:hypothetical protein